MDCIVRGVAESDTTKQLTLIQSCQLYLNKRRRKTASILNSLSILSLVTTHCTLAAQLVLSSMYFGLWSFGLIQQVRSRGGKKKERKKKKKQRRSLIFSLHVWTLYTILSNFFFNLTLLLKSLERKKKPDGKLWRLNSGTVGGAVQLHSLVWLFVTPWTAAHQTSCPSPSPGGCSNSCSLSQWCHPTISFQFENWDSSKFSKHVLAVMTCVLKHDLTLKQI